MWRRCSPWSGHLAAVERALTAGTGAQSHGGANAPKNARNGGEERENCVDRGVVGAPTHSGELHRTRETHRARLSASTGCGRTRRSRRWSQRGGRRTELAERGPPSVDGDGARRSSCGCVRAREWARPRAERRVWQPGAPSGRPGRVQATACSPRGGRALPARHGGTARPSACGHGAGTSAGKGASAGVLGRLRPVGQK